MKKSMMKIQHLKSDIYLIADGVQDKLEKCKPMIAKILNCDVSSIYLDVYALPGWVQVTIFTNCEFFKPSSRYQICDDVFIKETVDNCLNNEALDDFMLNFLNTEEM